MAESPAALRDERMPDPTTVTDVSWLYAICRDTDYPLNTPNSGKWLIFVPPAEVNETWGRLSAAVEAGQLGRYAKCSTARPSPHARGEDYVICVYTYDWRDAEDVHRIRESLREMGFTTKLVYKSDEDTRAGRYSGKGDRRIAKYYA